MTYIMFGGRIIIGGRIPIGPRGPGGPGGPKGASTKLRGPLPRQIKKHLENYIRVHSRRLLSFIAFQQTEKKPDPEISTHIQLELKALQPWYFAHLASLHIKESFGNYDEGIEAEKLLQTVKKKECSIQQYINNESFEETLRNIAGTRDIKFRAEVVNALAHYRPDLKKSHEDFEQAKKRFYNNWVEQKGIIDTSKNKDTKTSEVKEPHRVIALPMIDDPNDDQDS